MIINLNIRQINREVQVKLIISKSVLMFFLVKMNLFLVEDVIELLLYIVGNERI